jgi:hypothetical protein
MEVAAPESEHTVPYRLPALFLAAACDLCQDPASAPSDWLDVLISVVSRHRCVSSEKTRWTR